MMASYREPDISNSVGGEMKLDSKDSIQLAKFPTVLCNQFHCIP